MVQLRNKETGVISDYSQALYEDLLKHKWLSDRFEEIPSTITQPPPEVKALKDETAATKGARKGDKKAG